MEPKSAATLAAVALEDLLTVELRVVVDTRELELRLVARAIPPDPPPDEEDTPLSSPLMAVAETDGPLALELLELLDELDVEATLAVELELEPPPPLPRREL